MKKSLLKYIKTSNILAILSLFSLFFTSTVKAEENITAPSGEMPHLLIYSNDGAEEMCTAILDRWNEHGLFGYPISSWGLHGYNDDYVWEWPLPNDPNFKRPDWQPIDWRENMDLLRRGVIITKTTGERWGQNGEDLYESIWTHFQDIYMNIPDRINSIKLEHAILPFMEERNIENIEIFRLQIPRLYVTDDETIFIRHDIPQYFYFIDRAETIENWGFSLVQIPPQTDIIIFNDLTYSIGRGAMPPPTTMRDIRNEYDAARAIGQQSIGISMLATEYSAYKNEPTRTSCTFMITSNGDEHE